MVLASASYGQKPSYLCIAEREGVTMRPYNKESNNSFESYGQASEQRFIINSEGLSLFGQNFLSLDFCFTADNGTVTCENTRGFAGWFQKMPNNLFEFVRMMGNDTHTGFTTYVGECSRI